MITTVDSFLQAATQLHGYLCKEHWNGHALSGPDAGVRFNSRIGRFAKSYLQFRKWSDDRIYMQCQAYWILDNWRLAELLDDRSCRDIAMNCSSYVVRTQLPDGYWAYPDPVRKGKIATVEGDFATLGLLETYRRTGERSFLLAAEKWYHFLVDQIGFQNNGDFAAVNYFAGRSGSPVPNNSALTLRTLARLARATGDDRYLVHCPRMVAFLKRFQLESGELPYMVGLNGPGRPHFLCYQYNAFELLDLADYYDVTGDTQIRPVMEKIAVFLCNGLTESGAVRYNCHRQMPEVLYYASAVAAALRRATSMRLGDFDSSSDVAYQWVLSHQRPDGGAEFFSRANYGFLADRRSYPRNLAMILYHFLFR